MNTLNEKELENVIFEAINNQTKRNRLGKNARQSFIKKFASDKVFRNSWLPSAILLNQKILSLILFLNFHNNVEINHYFLIFPTLNYFPNL